MGCGFWVIAVIAVMLAAVAFAQETVPSDSRSSYIVITLLNQDPDPVEPGRIVKVRFRVENRAGATPLPVEVEVLPDGPFSLYSGDKVRNVGIIGTGVTGSNAPVVDWKLRVDENAVEGTAELRIRYRIGKEAWTVYRDDNFLINIRTPDTVLIIDRVSWVPEKIEPGQTGKLVLSLRNTADSPIRNIRAKLDLAAVPFVPLETSAEQRIYQIESKGAAAFTYALRADGDASIKAYKIPVRLTYQDIQGNTFDKNDTIGAVVDTAPELGVYLQSSTLTVPEQKGKVVLQVVNRGLLDIRFLSISITDVQGARLLSPAEQYLGDTDPDDFETAEFEVLPGNVSEVVLSYALKGQDSTNRPVELSGERAVPLHSLEDAQALGLLPKDKTGYYIVAAIVLVALIIYAVVKRRR